jgi:hypothetical protein
MGIAVLILNLGARRGWVFSTTPRPLYPRKDPAPIVQEAGWAPGPVWTCVKNLASTGIRSPDRPARSQSLYRLRKVISYVELVRRFVRSLVPGIIVVADHRCYALQFQNRQSNVWEMQHSTALKL